MNLTPTGFGIIVAFLLIVAVIVVIAENLRDRWINASRELDAFLASEDDLYAQDDDRVQQQVARYHCAAHGCSLQVTSSDRRGTRYTCTVCERETWVPAASLLYDQATDVSEWEREVGA